MNDAGTRERARLKWDMATVDSEQSVAVEPAPRLVPALTIISHPDLARAGERLRLDALSAGREVALSRNAPDFIMPGAAAGEPLGDPHMSRTHPLRFVPAGPTRIHLRLDPNSTPVSLGPTRLADGCELSADDLARGVPLNISGRIVLLLHLAPVAGGDDPPAAGMFGSSAGMRDIRQHIRQIADLAIPVLIRGETGTGKELVARAIHDHSPRHGGPFIAVNLGAIPRELAESELFGVSKGAFTGATADREGFFRAARGGTLFLDEVGEASSEVQVKLLRVIETGEVLPVGRTSPLSSDARIIAATDAPLEDLIRDGRFKPALLYRLAGDEIRMPPLRERREDIGILFHHFARNVLEPLGETHHLAPHDPLAPPWLPPSIALRLVRYAWPGNVRELLNLTQQIVITSRGQPQLSMDPRIAARMDAALAPLPGLTPLPVPAPTASARRKPSTVTEAELLAALDQTGGDLKGAADLLGIPRSSIYDIINRSPELRTAGNLSSDEITRCFNECGGDISSMVAHLKVSRRALQRRLRELGLLKSSS